MSLKVERGVTNEDFDCIPNEIPDIPDVPDVPDAPAENTSAEATEAPKSYVKENTNEGEQPRKMFANKKANILLIVAGVITVLAITFLVLLAKTNLFDFVFH